jgi:hypothetical protein
LTVVLCGAILRPTLTDLVISAIPSQATPATHAAVIAAQAAQTVTRSLPRTSNTQQSTHPRPMEA